MRFRRVFSVIFVLSAIVIACALPPISNATGRGKKNRSADFEPGEKVELRRGNK